MTQVHGTYDERFSKIRDQMQDFIASGQEVGASLCVNLDGETVVDLWGGHADAETKTPWERDTIVNVFSTTKLVSNLAVLVLASRGALGADDPVAKHWPEFGAGGKEGVTVAQVLAHTAGVCGWDDEMALPDLLDGEGAARRLVGQRPWWRPGEMIGYHAATQGVILGEVVRRVAGGRSLGRVVEEEIAAPLGADFRLGAREEDWGRVASVVPPEGPPIQELLSKAAGSISARTLLNPCLNAEMANTREWREAELGSLNGHTNARALAGIMSCLALGGTPAGRESPLLSGELVERALSEAAHGVNMVTGGVSRNGLGTYLTGKDTAMRGRLPEGRVCWGSGWGGSAVVMDAERGLTIAYAMNKMVDGDNPSAWAYIRGVYEALGVQLET